MPSPLTTTWIPTAAPRASTPNTLLRFVAVLSTSMATVSVAMGADECPGSRFAEAARPSPAPAPAPPEDSEIKLEVDSFDAARTGQWQLNGDVTLSQGDRQLKTRDATFDPNSETLTTSNAVEYADPNVKVQGSSAQFDPAGGADFDNAQFEMRGDSPEQRTGRGKAGHIAVTPQGRLSLDNVRYTTCPMGNDDWILKASDIDISQRSGIGTGRNVRLDFWGVPILYTPFISFPVSNERKSGFLFPDFGTSSSSGTSIIVPWYWNIAPNYDATLSPLWYTKRGGKLDTEFRYLTPFGHGTLNAEYLPDDREFGDSRSLLRFVDESNFSDRVRLNLDAANVGDDDWFEDFGFGPEDTSISYLTRLATLSFLDDHWFMSVRAHNLQIIDDPDRTDDDIAPRDRPYTLLPQVAMRARFPEQPFGLTLGLDSEWSSFDRNTGVTGSRMDVTPEIRMPLRASGIYLEPAVSWRYTGYSLKDLTVDDLPNDPLRDPAAPLDTTPHRSAPIMSVDGGMAFERIAGSRGQRLMTFEPRFMYLYVPYRNQTNLPLFDTDVADFNAIQLFRTNSYVGPDRQSNANQVSVGITSRLLDGKSGQQFISGTVGQAYYIDKPRVALFGETLDDTESSDIVAQLDVTAFRNWNIRTGLLWDPDDTLAEKGDVRIQYRPAHDSVINAGYRFRRDAIEQVDSSLAWPLSQKWSAYARFVYSLEEDTPVDQFAGFEYRACCWRVRFVARRYINSRSNNADASDFNTSFLLQLELNGLSSVGTGADTFLERAIQGYSSQAPEL
jgi:LPS-assembly protein